MDFSVAFLLQNILMNIYSLTELIVLFSGLKYHNEILSCIVGFALKMNIGLRVCPTKFIYQFRFIGQISGELSSQTRRQLGSR